MWKRITREEWKARKVEYKAKYKCDGLLDRIGEPPCAYLYEDTGKPFPDERKFLMVVYEWKGPNGEISDGDEFFEFYEWVEADERT